MIKLNSTQAKAIAHRINLDAQKAYNEKRENYAKELLKSKEYETMKKHVAEAIDAALIVYEYDDSLGRVQPNFWGVYINFDDTTDFEEYVKQAMNAYVNACIIRKLPYPYIREDELAQDIIFESIQCNDINELVKKFVDKYNG